MMTATMTATSYNRVDRIGVHLGLGGLITGYRFTKRLDAQVALLNSQGRQVVALYKNQWGLMRWFGSQLLTTITLTLVTLMPSVLIVSEPINPVAGGSWPPRT
jgi:hypothetical protein